jgi:hypothetical protein
MKDNYDLKNLKKPKKINGKRKGNKYENDLSKLLNKRFNTTDFARTPGSGAFATTHKLPSHLMIYGDLITPLTFRFVIEAKRGYSSLNILDLINNTSVLHGFISQNLKDCEKCDKDSLVIFKQDRRKAMAIVTLSEPMNIELKLILKQKDIPFLSFGDERNVLLLLDDILTLDDSFFFSQTL